MSSGWTNAEKKTAEKQASLDELRSMLSPYMVDGGEGVPLRHLVAAACLSMGRLNTVTEERDEALATIKNLENTREMLTNGLERLMTQVIALTPRLPLWYRVLFTVMGLALVAVVAHRLGFEAAMYVGGTK